MAGLGYTTEPLGAAGVSCLEAALKADGSVGRELHGVLATRSLGPLAPVCLPVPCPGDWYAWTVQLAAHSPCSYFSLKQLWLLYPTHYLSFTCSLTLH